MESTEQGKPRGLGCSGGRVRGHSQDQTASQGVGPRCWLCPEGGGSSTLAFVHIECLRGRIPQATRPELLIHTSEL